VGDEMKSNVDHGQNVMGWLFPVTNILDYSLLFK